MCGAYSQKVWAVFGRFSLWWGSTYVHTTAELQWGNFHHEDQSDYRGCQTKTRCGHTCQKWTDISPHEHGFDVGLYGDVGLGSHNYCRNPGHSDQGIWCFTTDPNKRWELCDPAGNPTREFDHYCEGTDPSDIDGGVHAYDWHRIRDTLMAANHVVQEDTPAEVAVQEQEMVDFLSVTPPPHHGMDKDHTNIIILFSCVMGVMLMIVIFCIWYTRRLMKSSYKQLKQERKKVTTKARKATYQHRFDDMLPKTPLSSELGKANFQRQRDFTAMSEMTASEKSAFPSGVL